MEGSVMATLRERIEAQPDRTFISVGANTGFVYQGFKDGAIPYFEEITDLCVGSLKKRINKLKEQNQTTVRFVDKRTKLIMEALEDMDEDLDIQKATGLIERCAKHICGGLDEIRRREKMIVKYTEDVFNFVPFLDRDVVDEYEKQIDPGIALIVEGAEDAPWFLGDEEVRYLYSGQTAKRR